MALTIGVDFDPDFPAPPLTEIRSRQFLPHDATICASQHAASEALEKIPFRGSRSTIGDPVEDVKMGCYSGEVGPVPEAGSIPPGFRGSSSRARTAIAEYRSFRRFRSSSFKLSRLMKVF